MAKQPIVSNLTVRCILGLLAALLLYKAAKYGALPAADGSHIMTDFQSFHLAGQLAWLGKAELAYSSADFFAYQRMSGSGDRFLPWAYPPPFSLFAAALALLPPAMAYVIFTGSTLAAFLAVLRRLAGDDFPYVLAAISSVSMIAVSSGQNAFLIGTLIGLACIWMMEQRSIAGVPLGLMVIKPHLAVPLALAAFALRRWRVIAVAALTVFTACAAATVAFGMPVWPAFLSGAAQAKVFLLEANYPLMRMVSAYATLRTLGATAPIALTAQAISALLVLAMVGAAIWRKRPDRQVLGMAVMACPFVSPYAYDYDVCIFGVGLALLMPDLKRLMTDREQLTLLCLSFGGGAMSMVQQARGWAVMPGNSQGAADSASVGGVLFLMAVIMIWRALERDCAPAEIDLRSGTQCLSQG